MPRSSVVAAAGLLLVGSVTLGCSTTAGMGQAKLPATPVARATTHQPSASARPAPKRVPTVVLDPGHNGGNAAHPEIINRQVPAGNGRTKPCNTTGTATDAGYPEHAFNWDVAQRVAAILRRQHVRIVLTRGNDTGVGPCVDRRAEIGNRARAAAVVSIHGDGASVGHGFQVIQATGDTAGARIAAASRRLAVDVHDRLRVGTGLTTADYIGHNGYSQRSDLAGLNLSVRPSILIECGNMRNPGDAALMTSTTGRQRIAVAIAAGITGFLGR